MADTSEHDAIVQWLGEPAAYPHQPPAVERIETHISQLFLAGDQVFKLKKPVRFDFLDFSTLAAREHACREELRLNRRLAADTYLDVVPIVRQTTTGEPSFQIGGEGEVVDWLVHMRRLPTDQTLEALIRRDALRPEQIDRLAEVLARFYDNQSPLPLSPKQYRQRVLEHARGNRQALLAAERFLPKLAVLRVHNFQLQLLQLHAAIFDERVLGGRIVEGHGDLRPEHICLASGEAGDRIAIFDCLEFNAEFRQIDVADELAFLAAECDCLDAPWVGPQVWQRYQERTGDQPPAVLLDFYKSYRVCVRAKVAALRADQLTGDSRNTAVAESRRHLDLADRYAAPWLQPLVIALGGLSGTGKTTLANALAESLGAELLRTDVVRREIFGSGPHTAEADAGIYSPNSRAHVYEEMLRRAAELHREGVAVILDGTFADPELLRRAQSLAGDARVASFLAIECVCAPEVAHARITQRLKAAQDPSDATPATHDLQRRQWQPWPADIPQVRVDTEGAIDVQCTIVFAALRQPNL